jgi:hypothetical protein
LQGPYQTHLEALSSDLDFLPRSIPYSFVLDLLLFIFIILARMLQPFGLLADEAE